MSASANSTRKIARSRRGNTILGVNENHAGGECCIAKKVIGMSVRIDRIANGFVGHCPDHLHEAPADADGAVRRHGPHRPRTTKPIFAISPWLAASINVTGARMRIDAKRELANVSVSVGIFLRRNIT